MNSLKRALGAMWMILGPLAVILLLRAAYLNIDAAGTRDINKPVPWLIIIAVFTPIAAGLVVFGYYALKGDYDREGSRSATEKKD